MTSWIFFGPSKLIALSPYAGAMIALALIVMQIGLNLRRQTAFGKTFFREPAVFAGLLWLIFGFYEMQVAAALPTAKANAGAAKQVSELFRLDLVVLVPILYLLSALAIWSIGNQLRKTK
jgi:hypothetical protein